MSQNEDSSYPSYERQIEGRVYTICLVDDLPAERFVEISSDGSILLNVNFAIPAQMEGYEEFVLDSILMAVALHSCGSSSTNDVLGYFTKIRKLVANSNDDQEDIDDWIDDICGYLPE
ncbi:MAG: hypothetical protein P1P90_02535 [Patescibacteria group bacterium]|nr:hypothetical protein [Patescibacteria group bacterium]